MPPPFTRAKKLTIKYRGFLALRVGAKVVTLLGRLGELVPFLWNYRFSPGRITSWRIDRMLRRTIWPAGPVLLHLKRKLSI